MSAASAATRARSPGVTAAYLPALSVPFSDTTESQIARHLAIANCRNVEEVLALLPPTWAEFLGPPLRDISRLGTALAEKRRHSADLATHKAKGTLPAFIPKKRPSIQVSKELRESVEGQQALQRLQAEVDSQRSTLLDEAIAIASLEVLSLEAQVTDDKLFRRLSEVHARAAGVVKERRRYAEIVDRPDGTYSVSYKLSPAWEREEKDVREECREKLKKKREVKASAEVMEVDNKPSELQKAAERAVAKAVKKLKNVHASKPPATTGPKAGSSTGPGTAEGTKKKAKSQASPKKAEAAKAAATSPKEKSNRKGGKGGKGKGKGKAKAD
ncbi:hypothetical protein AX14_007656 [Amanita brunnescens Koide BX004]|nr:hypothetical protein AX14_007656 [Amanita brunnescens Koide BX004]